MAVYTLPDLPYDYAALEPHISGKIMELHHDKHHAAYVTGANTALEQLAEPASRTTCAAVQPASRRTSRSTSAVTSTTRSSGTNLSPDGGDKPTGELAAAIDEHFGSFDAFRKPLRRHRRRHPGLRLVHPGLGLHRPEAGHRPAVRPAGQHPARPHPARSSSTCWEHAFYLDYLNVRPDYVKAWWNIVSWSNVSERLARAKTQTAGLIVPSA